MPLVLIQETDANFMEQLPACQAFRVIHTIVCYILHFIFFYDSASCCILTKSRLRGVPNVARARACPSYPVD